MQRRPKVGDYVTLRLWHGDFYKVVKVTDRVFIEYQQISGGIGVTDYPIVNDWIFDDLRRANESIMVMEDTRDYLDMVSSLSIK